MDFLDKRYAIMDTIAAGGMGKIYKARDTRLERICVVKEMISSYKTQEDIDYCIKRFKAEAMILARLKHDNLPEVYDYFVDRGRYYLIMEYVEGNDLEIILEQKGKPGLPDTDVVSWSKQILSVLIYLHEQTPPIIYRDLKPSNIIIRKADNRAMLIDFGIARVVQSKTQKTAVGTVGYTPVEQYRGEPEPRSDIYALGVTMHHLISGVAPIPFQFEDLKKIVSGISHRVSDVVMKAVEHEPEDRFSSAREMLDALTGKTSEVKNEKKPRKVEVVEVKPPPKASDTRVVLHPTIASEKDNSTMILIPEGEFLMGNDRGPEDEMPARQVHLRPYYIDKYPVTNGQFETFVKNTGYKGKLDWQLYSTPQTIKHPVINITWNDARNYAGWAGKRLPTEAEWEKAARGTDGRLYPWGNDVRLNNCNNLYLNEKRLAGERAKLLEMEEKYLLYFKRKSWRGTLPTGCFPDGASPYGVMDMIGNVFEWCFDWYDKDYYKGAPSYNPQGPGDDNESSFFRGKALRGGSWNKEIYTCSQRTCKGNKDISPLEWGFRCVKDP